MADAGRPSPYSGEHRVDMPFSGIASFMRSQVAADIAGTGAEIAVIGVPTDEGSPFMPGSRFGPRAIREHSLRFVTGEPGYFDPDLGRRLLGREVAEGKIVDLGDADVLPTNVVATFENVTRTVRHALDGGAMPVVLGGDHAITFPVVRAFEDRGPLDVIHFDAHLDYMPFVHGLEYTNQHAFRHIRRMANVRTIQQVGIRSIRNTEVMFEDSRRDGNHVVTMSQFEKNGPGEVLGAVEKGARCYVSIDIDVLDMSLIPGCVSAEPGGMSYAQLRSLLRAIAAHTEVVGFDLVEVNPLLDVRTGITSYLGAHTVIEFLGAICEQPWWVERHRG